MKKTILVLTLLMFSFMLLGCKESSASNEFTFWIPTADGSDYFTSYSEHPVVKYLEHTFDVKLNFVSPIAGSEQENFNTLLATGEYPDVMDIVYYQSTGSVSTLYEDGIALDLTSYIEDGKMPNYTQFLDDNPTLKMTSTVDDKYLQIYSYNDGYGEAWGGFMYRRDWVAKYGKNPFTGDSFTYSYNPEDKNDFTDNIIFPNGTNEPLTIADWEWMLEIFKNIPDATYPMSIPYRGYYETGDLVSSFGKGPYWNITRDGNSIEFGAVTDEFRAYIEQMHEWHKKGYIDPSFDTRAQDAFYLIDTPSVFSGNVGIWYGISSQMNNAIESAANPATEGIMVYGMNSPLLDDRLEPHAFYQVSLENTSYVITDKAKDKDLDLLLKVIDHMYSQEGGLLRTFGLDAEQIEEINNTFMIEQGLAHGSYYTEVDEVDGKTYYYRDDIITEDGGGLPESVFLARFPGLVLNAQLKFKSNNATEEYNNMIFYRYQAIGNFSPSFTSQISNEDMRTIGQIQSSVRNYMEIEVAKFVINGISDAQWVAFQKKLIGYNYKTATDIYQSYLDLVKGE